MRRRRQRQPRRAGASMCLDGARTAIASPSCRSSARSRLMRADCASAPGGAAPRSCWRRARCARRHPMRRADKSPSGTASAERCRIAAHRSSPCAGPRAIHRRVIRIRHDHLVARDSQAPAPPTRSRCCFSINIRSGASPPNTASRRSRASCRCAAHGTVPSVASTIRN